MTNKKYIFIIALLVSFVGFAQSTITGVVKDQDNQPLPGASILIKNTTLGTMTDFDGNFSIDANADDVIVISMIGMVTKNIKVGAQTNLDVVLKADVANLDEVVVIGYGSTTKKI